MRYDNNESFNKYLFSTYYFLGTVLSVGDTAVKKMTSPWPPVIYIRNGSDGK